MALLIPSSIETVACEYEIEFGALGILHDHPELPALFEEMAPALREFFPSASLSVELAIDREGTSTYLAVFAHTALSLDEADEKLTAFDRSWWRQNRRRAGGRVMVDVKFSP